VAIAAADFLFMRMEVERKYGAVALRKTDTRYYSTALCFVLYLAYLKLIATPPPRPVRKQGKKPSLLDCTRWCRGNIPLHGLMHYNLARLNCNVILLWQ
jgi:hypothetical protein